MAREMKDSGIAWLGEIPVGWVIKRNKALFYEINERCVNGSEYTLLSVSEYTGVLPRNQIIEEGEFETHAESLDGYKICTTGDIVMNIMLAWKRATARTEYDGIVSPAYCIYRGRDIDTRYYHYLFRTDLCADHFKRFSTGIIDSRLRLYPNVFLSLDMPVPPLPEQSRIAAFLDRRCAEIDRVIAATQRTIEEYKKLKQSIITEAVTHGVRGPRKMKDSGVEWIGEIPEEWGVAGSRFVIDQIGDVDHYMPASMDQGYPYIMTGNLRDKLSRIDLAACKKITQADYEKLCSKITCSIGDVIYARYATIGTVCYVDVDIQCIVSYSCVIIKPRRNKMMGRFLYYYLQSSTFSEEVRQYIKSNTQENVGIEALYRTKIPVSSITEQTEIADYLDHRCAEIDRLIEAKQQLLTQLEAYKKSVIYEYVTGKREFV